MSHWSLEAPNLQASFIHEDHTMPKRRTCIPGWTKVRTRMFMNLQRSPVLAGATNKESLTVQPERGFTDEDVTKIALAEAKRFARMHRRIARGF